MNNETTIMKEREISLLDLCIEILIKWRVILICMLVGAVLFAGLSYVQSKRDVLAQKANVEKTKEQLEQIQLEAEEAEKQAELELGEEVQEIDSAQINRKMLEKQMTELELHNVDYVLTYEQLYEDKLAYMEQSVLMQMDPNAVKKADITFYITSEDVNKTYNIQKAYEDIACSGELMEELAEKMDLSTAAIAELIGLERTSYSTIEGTDNLRMYVKHYDKATCEEIAKTIIDFVGEKQSELQEFMGTHEITVLEQSITTVADTAVMDAQKACSNDIITLRNKIIELKNSFDKLEWQYYDIRLNGELTELSEQKIEEIKEEEAKAIAAGKATADEGTVDIAALEEIIETGVTATPGISLKYVILGMVLAAFVYVFIIFMAYIFNNKVRSTDSLQELYGINQLGQIPGEQGKKKIFGFVDKWILSFRYRNKRRFSEAEALELASVAVKMAVGKASLDKVCLIGCDLKDASLKVCEQMQSSLQKENLQVQILNNVLYDAQAMEQLENAKCVVLVEKAGSTLYEEIAQELELLKRQDITVLGGIVVE